MVKESQMVTDTSSVKDAKYIGTKRAGEIQGQNVQRIYRDKTCRGYTGTNRAGDIQGQIVQGIYRDKTCRGYSGIKRAGIYRNKTCRDIQRQNAHLMFFYI
jgi:hypothetical protein